MKLSRRSLLLAPLLGGGGLAPAGAAPDAGATTPPRNDPVGVLRAGGVVALFRHARAPGTFDPPGMNLGDCSTQRNLDDAGRAQARRLGAWFAANQLQPAAVRASPWCRCVDTAQIAFGRHVAWAALGSPSGREPAEVDAQQRSLRAALGAVPPGRFEVWVTHQFVISAIAGVPADSAEGVVLRTADATVAARIPPA